MEGTRLVIRLLSEVAAARAAIGASYLRLWRPDRLAGDHTPPASPRPSPSRRTPDHAAPAEGDEAS